MTRYYHQRFFADTRATAVGVVVLALLGFWEVPEAFLFIPVIALLGANQTAFDASYLYFARKYAASLEEMINDALRRKVLVGAEMEDRYLVPLSETRLVGVAFGSSFSWFGWMTLLYTLFGVLAYVGGLALGWEALDGAWVIAYPLALGALTVASLAVGLWWFGGQVGMRRLDEVLAGLGALRARTNG